MAYTNFEAALHLAEGLDPGLLVLEGSGAAIPPSHFDGGVLVVNAGLDPGFLCGYFGLYRLLLADLVVFTMCEESLGRAQRAAVERCARSRPLSQPKVVCTVFRPHPLADVSGKKIWLGTTADERAGPTLKQHLEDRYGCEVIGVSHALARRDELRRDLDALGAPGGVGGGLDAVVVELKAAAVDVVTRWGLERGVEVIYLDNRPHTVDGDGPLDDLLLETAAAARERFG
jgi:cyclic 2,3-diphosphoglycerate synthetase